MGTEFEFILVAPDESEAIAAIEAAIEELRRVQALAEQASAIGETPAPVDPELIALLRQAKWISLLTDGKFDVTFPPLADLWGLGGPDPRVPDPPSIEEVARLVDYEKLILDEIQGTARLDKGMRIGLGGIAKGYAIDRAAYILLSRGSPAFAISGGGDIIARGRVGGQSWPVRIQHPRDPEGTIAVLPMYNASVATSGDYERFAMIDGQRYCHIIDPDTGYPARTCQSVTVWARDTTSADALATGVFVLGPERGMDLIESQPKVEGIIVDARGEVHTSSGLVRAPETYEGLPVLRGAPTPKK
jgi:thiamine biosynthesis lipoprotein